jgi:hypothetical protein
VQLLTTSLSIQGQAKEFHELHGIFKIATFLFWLSTLPLNENDASYKKKHVPVQEIHWLKILETTSNIRFLLPSLQERVHVGL